MYGVPKTDIERLTSHYGVTREEAQQLMASYPIEDLLPERGTGMLPQEITGYTLDEMSAALQVMEDSIDYGEWCAVQLCLADLPSREELDLAYSEIIASGHHVSPLTAGIVGGIPTVSFNIKKGSPFWPLIIPLLVPIATIGLITFGIVQIDTISKALLPLVLVTIGGVVLTAAILSRPATKYIERGGKLPYLPSVVPKNLPAAKKKKPTRNQVRVEVWEERDRLHIGLQDKKTGEYYADWWDDDARQMFEDGFFKGGRGMEESVLEYGEYIGILAGPQGHQFYPASDIQKGKVKHDLAKSIREENEAINVYRERGNFAKSAGDQKTAALYEEIAREEIHHKQELQDRGKAMGEQYSTAVRKIARDDVEVYVSLPPFRASIWVDNKTTGETIWKLEGAENINRFAWKDQSRDQLEERVLRHLEDSGILATRNIPGTYRDDEFITVAFHGDTTFKNGELVSRAAFDKENNRVVALGRNPASGYTGEGVMRSRSNGHAQETFHEYKADNTPDPRKEQVLVSDSPELLAFTIEDIGYREKLDGAFKAAIARVNGR